MTRAARLKRIPCPAAVPGIHPLGFHLPAPWGSFRSIPASSIRWQPKARKRPIWAIFSATTLRFPMPSARLPATIFSRPATMRRGRPFWSLTASGRISRKSTVKTIRTQEPTRFISRLASAIRAVKTGTRLFQ